jgi:hypothetical protein
MIAGIYFGLPWAWQAGLPAVLLLVLGVAWLQARRGVPKAQVSALAALRGAALLALAGLAARPVWVTGWSLAGHRRPVVVLLDRSQSMAVRDGRQTRYQEALRFLNSKLLPSLKSAGLPVRVMLFDQSAVHEKGNKLRSSSAQGRRTNLGGAIAEAMRGSSEPPLALIGLTDGIANVRADDQAGLAALVQAGAPFIGVGFGSDQGAPTIWLRHVNAPANVPPHATFNVSVELDSNVPKLPAFDLVLLRDGKFCQKKRVQPGPGPRTWREEFVLSESRAGKHDYSVQLLPPALPELKLPELVGDALVRITDPKPIRVLYIQGALTWDYKFIGLALADDPTIKLTGLTRTSDRSVFRQNVRSAGELVHGFPTSLKALKPFGVVVLSNLRAADLSAAQQEILARFCWLGGGILMIGGPSAFDASWRNSRLEQILPVKIASNPEGASPYPPFHIQLTPEALRSPMFQFGPGASTAKVWGQLPTFARYACVDSAKPGAQVWMVHPTHTGPHGQRILMASERYGAGISAVLCLQNFWRWRLMKDSDPAQFDRFWKQVFRYLGEAERPKVSIQLADADLHPRMNVRVVLAVESGSKAAPDSQAAPATGGRFSVRVTDGRKKTVHEESVALAPMRPAQFRFHAGHPDTYSVSVLDSSMAVVATRAVRIRERNLEFQDTARNMETLRQWAAASHGFALKAEECPDATRLIRQIRATREQTKHEAYLRQPLGLNGWSMGLVLGCLGGEWLLRKKWRLE